ncbi:hypothetical protein [Bacillus cereus group sp. N6]|uniref:hypothetical protein n=1 Tax=Bacillus cereus group sp. N6 TaxID=2794583 RepID=UPI001F5B9693|nr:hypothetical protein [Bacillus cereus group sp. N6]
MGKEYFNKAVCLVCGHQDRVNHPSKKEYHEVTVCPKCNGAFVDVWKLGKYKQLDNTQSNEEPVLTITLTDIDAKPIVHYKGEQSNHEHVAAYVNDKIRKYQADIAKCHERLIKRILLSKRK